MKNLHIIPTDKPSRIKQEYTYKPSYVLSRLPLTWRYAQNIYITSDEEIKEGDFGYNTISNTIDKFTKSLLSNKKFYKKIILTTDQDLIADGVQIIDDEFLEWFVNNPSCEEVEVKLENYYASGALQPNLWKYKVIIPKDEPKQTFDKSKYISGIDPYDKKETLKEAGERLYPIILEDDGWDKNKQYRDEWIEGAKYQAERMYSEEEVLGFGKFCVDKIASFLDGKGDQTDGQEYSMEELFDQFKKK